MCTVHFRYRGRRFGCREGQTIDQALLDNGIIRSSYSFRLRDSRDDMHPIKTLPSAWLSVNGIPNFSSTEMVVEDMDIREQTRFRPLSLLGRYMGTGFYYRIFYRSERLRRAFLNAVAVASDQGGMPDFSESAAHQIPFAASETIDCRPLIAGAGPAGLMCLLCMDPSTQSTVILDALPYRSIERNYQLLRERLSSLQPDFLKGKDIPADLGQLIRERNARLYTDTVLFGYYGNGLFAAVQNRRKILLLEASRRVIATGSEQIKPLFRGNFLPGVITSFQLSSFPYRYAGAEKPLLYLMRKENIQTLEHLACGVHFSSVICSFPLDKQYAASLADTFHTDAEMVMSGKIENVSGRRHVRGAVVRCNLKYEIKTDLIAVHGRTQPRFELLALMDMPLRYSDALHSPLPVYDAGMRVDDSTFVCGSVTGLQGDESVISSYIAASSLEGKHASVGDSASFKTRSEALQDAADRTDMEGVVCPCMDVTATDIRSAYSCGYSTINRIKRFSGLFMGPCQGTRCFRNAFELYARLSSSEPDLPTIRPPLVPVYLGALAESEIPGEGL